MNDKKYNIIREKQGSSSLPIQDRSLLYQIKVTMEMSVNLSITFVLMCQVSAFL